MSKNDVLDISELTEFAQDLLTLASRTMPKESKKFLQKEGNKLKNVTKKTARKSVKKKTGNYIKGIKRGKVYKYLGQDLSVRVYGTRHAHLIEYGHRQVVQNGRTDPKTKKKVNFKRAGKEVGFVKGKRVFQRSAEEYQKQFVQNCETFIDELLNKGGLK